MLDITAASADIDTSATSSARRQDWDGGFTGEWQRHVCVEPAPWARTSCSWEKNVCVFGGRVVVWSEHRSRGLLC